MSSTNNNVLGRDADPDPAVRALVVAVARTAHTYRDEIAQLIIDRLVSEIQGIAHDQRLVDLIRVGAEASVAANIQMLEHDIDVKWMAVPGATAEYIRLVAQRGYPVAVLEQASRLTRNVMLQWCLGKLGAPENDPVVVAKAAVDLLSRLTASTESIYRQLLEIYEVAHEAWLRDRTAARSARIHDILEGRPFEVADAEATLAYRLDQWHLGLVAWIAPSERSDALARLDRAVTTLAKKLGCQSRPLLEPRDERTAWAWIPLGVNGNVKSSDVVPTIDSWNSSVMVALGAAHEGREGFVRTHEQAAQAAVVAQASKVSGLHVVPIEDVGAVALMCSDLPLARKWVREVLGPLAEDDATIALYRETLRIFLASGGSYTTTALSLTMHKNSVMYRLRKIEGLLGRSVREKRLDLENALALCNWLGPAVLHSKTPTE